MLRALERAGYVEQLAESREYRLTLKLFELGSRVASRTTLRDLAAVEVERLAHQAGLASNVSVLVDGDVLYLAQVKTEDLLAVNLTPGSRAPPAPRWARRCWRGTPATRGRSSGPGRIPAGPPTRSPPTRPSAPNSPTSSASVTPSTGRSSPSACGAWRPRSWASGRPGPPRSASPPTARNSTPPRKNAWAGAVIAAASRISDRLGGLGNMDAW